MYTALLYQIFIKICHGVQERVFLYARIDTGDGERSGDTSQLNES